MIRVIMVNQFVIFTRNKTMQQSHEKTKPAKRENAKQVYAPVKGKPLQRDKLREAKRNYWM